MKRKKKTFGEGKERKGKVKWFKGWVCGLNPLLRKLVIVGIEESPDLCAWLWLWLCIESVYPTVVVVVVVVV